MYPKVEGSKGCSSARQRKRLDPIRAEAKVEAEEVAIAFFIGKR